MFHEKISPSSSGSKTKPSKKQHEDGSEHSLLPAFVGLHGVISQKIEIFITTAVRNPNPIYVMFLLKCSFKLF
jgi:hypothetical protein